MSQRPESFSWRALVPGGHLRTFPLGAHLRGYGAESLRHDAAAGVNVALLAIPQGMAYAMIAGMPHEGTGILCSAVASVAGAVFAASRHTILGPTNATALMAFSVSAGLAASVPATLLLPALVFLAGLFLIIGAGLRMADMVQYISRSVIVGYVAGAGLLIAAGQLRDVLGITDGPRGTTFFSMLFNTLTSLESAHWWSAGLGVATAAGYMVLRRMAPRWPAFAIVLAAAALVTALLPERSGLARLHSFRPEELLPAAPDLTLREGLESLSHLFGPAMALAFLAALESTVTGKALTGRTGAQASLNQDLLASGIANVGCAFAGGVPASGSLTRSALNFTSGARTPVSSLVCGLVCFAAALLLGPVMPFIPRPALAALVICLAASLINRRHLRICLRATRSDAITLAVTLAGTLLMPLHVAIFVGVAASVVLYLRKAARPMLVEYEFGADGALQEKQQTNGRQNPGISIVHVEGELFFGAAELFRTQIQRTAQDENLKIIILRMKNARHLDATSVMALEELIGYLRSNGRHLLISGLSREVYRVLRNSGMVEVVGRENIFMGSAANPNISTRNALKRAQELLGTKNAEVRIFYDPAHERKE